MTQSKGERLQGAWFRGVHNNKEEKEKREALIRNSHDVLSILLEIVEDMQLSVLEDESTEVDYTGNDWAYLQAHRNGKKEALKTVKGLLQHLN
jgi:hypothetical protein